MKKFTFVLILSLCSLATSYFATPVKAGILKPSSYIPAVFDYVKPAVWSNMIVPYPVISDGTGLPNPYNTYFKVSNVRCQVINPPFTLNGLPQLYVNLLIVGTDYIVIWPVNYVPTFGMTQDYLTKIL